MLRAQDHSRFEAYIDRVFERFWKRELEIEDPVVIASVLEEAGVPAAGFPEWREKARAAGVTTPSEGGGGGRHIRRAELSLQGRIILGRRPPRHVARTDRGGAGSVIELWIPVTIFAAFCQNLRSAVQKHLKGVLSTAGATFSRFGYGVPVLAAYVLALHYGAGMTGPSRGRNSSSTVSSAGQRRSARHSAWSGCSPSATSRSAPPIPRRRRCRRRCSGWSSSATA